MLINHTPYAAERTWLRNRDGQHVWVVAVKATYELRGHGGIRLADEPQKLFDKNQNPLAKLDGGLADHKESAGKYLERGFDVEIVP